MSPPSSPIFGGVGFRDFRDFWGGARQFSQFFSLFLGNFVGVVARGIFIIFCCDAQTKNDENNEIQSRPRLDFMRNR